MGFLIINQQNSKNEVTIKFDEKRLSILLLFLLRHQSWIEDPSSKNLNKIFVSCLRDKLNVNIDENNEKKYYMNWTLDNFVRMTKNFTSFLDVTLF